MAYACPVSVRPTRAEVDIAAIVANAERLSSTAGVPLWAVVKADAYGHGAVEVARALAPLPSVCGLAVSLIEEALELRAAMVAAPILVMGPSLAPAYDQLVAADLIPVLSDLADVEAVGALGRARGKPVPVHLKVDTGMNRIGLHTGDLDRALASDGLAVAGIATHLACADEDDPGDGDSLSRRQLIRFATASARLRRRGLAVQRHAANSSALIKFDGSRLDAARPGIGLYGNGLARDLSGAAQAMCLVTEVAQVREVAAGESVSYGSLWTAAVDSSIAVLPIGYADGYPRRLTGRAEVVIGGTRMPVVGAVCMDMVMVDVTRADPPVRPGDGVVLLGGEGTHRITATELARWAGISEYEVTCGISKRVPRRLR